MKDIQFLPGTDSDRIRRREAGRNPVPDVYNVAGSGCKLVSRDALPASLHKRAAAKSSAQAMLAKTRQKLPPPILPISSGVKPCLSISPASA
jgi:hypothetical protein